jgi:hypothetical protein
MLPKDSIIKSSRLLPVALAVLAGIILLAAVSSVAGESGERQSFLSPRKAVDALIAALQDNNDAELLHIFGPDSGDLISSGDKVADQHDKENFLKAYQEKNDLQQMTEDRSMLFVGAEDYPFPIPIIKQGDSWIFDTPSGMEEILNRLIGRNELHTIEVMRAYTAAQREYACIPRNGGGSEFAQRFASSEGKKDGLYWQVSPGEEESPFGPLIARATEEGYAGGLDKDPPEPFHGYYFKILTAQGENASGGAFDYMVDGKMVLGFGLVAYPAKYGVSGIMTFIVNQEGVIYENDLGEDTVRAAQAMTTFDPDDTWNIYEDSAEQ